MATTRRSRPALALALTTPALANPVPTCDSGACTLENAGIPSTLNNYVGGQFVPPTLGQYATTTSPAMTRRATTLCRQ